MNNAQVFTAFADKKAAHSGNVKTVLIDAGSQGTVCALYSYQTPIALNSKYGISFDDRSYSPTTSKQAGQARFAAGVSYDKARMPHDRFRKLCKQLGVDLSGAR